MATDLTIYLENRPGTLAEVGEALGNAGVNIEGGCGFPCEGRGVMHVLVNDEAAARSALEGAGIQVAAATEVMVVDVVDVPGSLGAVTRKMADAGVNVELLYLATNTRLAMGVDDMEKARGAM
jgi:hypothetical protein